MLSDPYSSPIRQTMITPGVVSVDFTIEPGKQIKALEMSNIFDKGTNLTIDGLNAEIIRLDNGLNSDIVSNIVRKNTFLSVGVGNALVADRVPLSQLPPYRHRDQIVADGGISKEMMEDLEVLKKKHNKKLWTTQIYPFTVGRYKVWIREGERYRFMLSFDPFIVVTEKVTVRAMVSGYIHKLLPTL